MSETEIKTSGGIGFGGAFFLVLLTLKITGYIDLSWWWVAGPLWIPLAFILCIWVIIGVVLIGIKIVENIK